MTTGALTAKYAQLVEAGLKIPEILELSPRQIHSIYFHKRNQDGTVAQPAQDSQQQQSTASRLQTLLALIEAGHVKADRAKIAELRRRIDGERQSAGEAPLGSDGGGERTGEHPQPARKRRNQDRPRR